MSPFFDDLLVALALFAPLLVALETGFRVGRSAASSLDSNGISQIGSIQGAILGMLGLLLAFSFAAAGSRFMERQDLILQEANAIGTAWLRADLLDEPHRSELRRALASYTEHRVGIFAGGRVELDADDLAQVERLQAQIWSASLAGIAARPAIVLATLNPVNELIDLHSTRLAAARKHLPYLVLGLLTLCSLVAVGVIGYGCGIGGRRRLPLTLSLVLLIGTALWITIDLDYPRRGLIRLDDTALATLHLEVP